MTVAPKKKKVKLPPGPEYVLDEVVVPLPERPKLGAKQIYFPFDVLEVGRSFTTRRSIGTIRKSVRRFRLSGNEDKHFMVEPTGDGKVRCWRDS